MGKTAANVTARAEIWTSMLRGAAPVPLHTHSVLLAYFKYSFLNRMHIGVCDNLLNPYLENF